MVINIRKLFKQRTQRKFRTSDQFDGWVTDILKSRNEVEYYITSKSLDDDYTIHDIKEILNKGFFISAVFYCGNIFTSREEEVCLFVFDRKKPETIKLGYKELKSFNKKYNSKHSIEVNTQLPKEYKQYIFEIENWVNNNIKPKNYEQNADYGEIKYEKYFPDANLNPRHYLEIINSTKNIAKNAKLSDYADVIIPKNLIKMDSGFQGMHVKVITAEKYAQPFTFKDLDFSFKSTEQLQKNDILINNKNQIYFHKEKYISPVYVSPNNQVIIRAKDNIDAKALYSVLKLDNELSYDNILNSHEVPIIEIKEGYNYNKIFSVLTGTKLSYIDEVPDEGMAQALKTCVLEQMQKVIQNDLNEIDSCYKGNAYKAAIVLCGSVLEAFLYDWLKEKKGEINKEWTLEDYIDQINSECGSSWDDAAEKADKIRFNRNLIHPERYVNSLSAIDKKLCDEMIKYLKFVTNTRGKV